MDKKYNMPNENMLQNIFLQSSNVIAITNADLDNLIFEYVNPAFLKMTGYTEDEIIGSSPKILQGPKTKKDMSRKLKEACKKGEIFRGNNINYKKDGSVYYVGWTVTPIKDENGEIVNFISYQKDITQIKKLEEEKIKTKKLEALKKISSGLTHEINTALTNCNGSLEMMKNELELLEESQSKHYLMQDSKEVTKSIQNIQYITNSLHYLTNNCYDLSTEHNLFDVILESVEHYKNKIKPVTKCTLNGNSIFENTKNEIYLKHIDKKALKHAFLNIIDNALDELIKKEDSSNNYLKIDICKENENCIITFSDNGGGIDKTYHQSIFEPLCKNKELGGLGIGLHVVKNIINAHNGDIKIISDCENTTTFRIVF
jgi:PAS domain S-box-containing protein